MHTTSSHTHLQVTQAPAMWQLHCRSQHRIICNYPFTTQATEPHRSVSPLA